MTIEDERRPAAPGGVAPDGDATEMPTPRRAQPVLLGIGALALVSAVLVAIVVLGSDSPGTAGEPSDSPSASATPTQAPSDEPTAAAPSPTPPATPTPGPTATPLPTGAAALRWTSGTAPDGFVYVVRWLGDRWLAAGSAGGRAAVWQSPDGLTWTAASAIGPEPVAGPEGTGYWITDVIEYGGEIIAVGWNRIGCCDGGRPIAWRSSDGGSWEILPTDGTAFEPHHFPGHLAIAPDGSLVLASHTGLGSGWITLTTRDLQAWERHEVTAPESLASVSDLVASPSTLLAVGTDVVPGTDPEHFQRVWSSSDGRTWREVGTPSTNGLLWGVTWDAAHTQFVAIGQDAEGRPAAWRSSDGEAWSAGITFDAGPGFPTSIASQDGLIVASGTLGEFGSELRSWSSYDGVTWQITDLGAGYSGQTVVGVRPGGATLFLRGTPGEPDYHDVFEVWAGE